MRMLMDENICDFTLKEANAARKVVGKKQMAKIPELHQQVLDKATSAALGQYVWERGIGPQMGYSFSIIHSLAYSFIGVQTIYLATNWNPIYWNTACLIVNSASLENEKEDDDDENTKDKSTDYSKLAKAIGDITSRGIKVSLININKSGFSFEPDETNNEILFGLKGVNKIGGPVINQIISGRPYTGIIDFMHKCSLNKTQMISLIKAGAFDEVDKKWAEKISPDCPRKVIMAYYLSVTCDMKKKLNLQNFNGLINSDLVPQQLNLQKNIFLFNKFLKAEKRCGTYYLLNSSNLETIFKNFGNEEDLDVIDGTVCISQSKWDKIYQKAMDTARDWLKNNQEEVLIAYNTLLFKNAWNKYAAGNISAWEMESLCFYYNEHELAHINSNKYGIVDFNKLSYESEVDYFIKRNGRNIPIYKLYRIAGTIISKDNTKAQISILTTTGVVTVKFTKEYYAMFNRQISQVQSDGTKKVLEKGWFSRGTKVLVTGYRREDSFVAKTYKATSTHQLYKITGIDEFGNIKLEHERIQERTD